MTSIVIPRVPELSRLSSDTAGSAQDYQIGKPWKVPEEGQPDIGPLRLQVEQHVRVQADQLVLEERLKL